MKAIGNFKQCSSCREIKDVSEFGPDKNQVDGFGIYCRPCKTSKSQEYQMFHALTQKEKDARYYIANKERINAKNKQYYLEHKEEHAARSKINRLKNKEAYYAKNKKWRLEHPDSVRRSQKKNDLKRKGIKYISDKIRRDSPEGKKDSRRRWLWWTYKITVEQYENMLKEQNNLCKICQKPETLIHHGKIKSLSVDHNHIHCSGRTSCGKCLRGLICDACNRTLGCFDDDEVRLERAFNYLQNTNLFQPSLVWTGGDKNDRTRWRQYQINREEYLSLLNTQNGLCSICLKKESRINKGKLLVLSVDHCHITNNIRGLLCQKCNAGLGSAHDSVEMLQSAIQYLNNYSLAKVK